MKAMHITLYFTGIKNRSVIVSATVSVHAYFESAENTPNILVFGSKADTVLIGSAFGMGK